MTMTPIFDALWAQMTEPEPASTRLSVETVWVLTLAEQEAAALGHARLGTEHLLLALVRGEASAGGLFAARGVTLPAARRAVSASPPLRPPGPGGDDDGAGWTAAAGTVLDAARLRAAHEGRAEVTPVDVAAALIRGRDTVALLAALDVRADELARALEHPAPLAA